MLWGVGLVTGLWYLGQGQPPVLPPLQWPSVQWEWMGWSDLAPWEVSVPLVLSFWVVAVLDVTATLHSVGQVGGMGRDRERGVYLAAGVASALGAVMGAPPVIVAVESVVGVKEGGRTGLTAVVAAGLFVAALFVAPLLAVIPPLATSFLLVLVGSFLFAHVGQVSRREAQGGASRFGMGLIFAV